MILTKKQKKKNDVYLQILSIEAELDQKVSPSTSTPINGAPVVPNFNTSIVPSVPVHKWGIKKFTGEGSLMAFLEKIETLRISRNCTTEELFSSAGDLFELQAWTWWHNNHIKNRFSNWDDLVEKLKGTFLRHNYDKNLLDEIKCRKQDPKESVSVFISSIEGLFYRLNTVPREKDIVDIIRENVLPDYVRALALHDIETISDLTNLCKKLENSIQVTSSYKPSFRGRYMEPDLSRPGFSAHSNVNAISTLKCWNCLSLGHKYNECSEQRNKFCYGCGLKNTTKYQCPHCSKNVMGSDKGNSPTNKNQNSNQQKDKKSQNKK